MHEGNFTEQIVQAILEELDVKKATHPKKVKVCVGEMLHLVPESVQFHYEVMTKGTPLEKAQLELEEIPVQVRCEDCHHVGPVEDHHLLLCSACDSRKVKVLAGEDVTIDEIEMEDAS